MRSCRQPHRLLFMQRSFFVSLCSGARRGAGACTRGAGSSRGGVLCGAAMRLAGAALEQMRASLTAHVELVSSRNSLPPSLTIASQGLGCYCVLLTPLMMSY